MLWRDSYGAISGSNIKHLCRNGHEVVATEETPYMNMEITGFFNEDMVNCDFKIK